MTGPLPPAGGLLAGRYRIEALLGRGSTGDVWSAHDLLTQRTVAIKRLRPEYLQDARLRRRLRREARAVARLEHPHIVRLYDVGEDEAGAPFLAMERVDGPTLVALGRDETVGVERLAALFDQVLAALAYAHARGVVHRDLKPHHVVVTRGPDGEDVVKLLDFGLARVENDADEPLAGIRREALGTPLYLAPEQATGEHDVGPAADLYAVGVMLWEVLCGAPPYAAPSETAVVVQHLTAPLPAFSPLPHRVPPPGMATLLAQALAKEPRRRFDSAAAMRRALAALFDPDDAEPTVVTAPPAFVRAAGVEAGAAPALVDPLTSEAAADVTASAVAVTLVAGPEEVPLVGREELQRWLWDRVVGVCTRGEARFVLLEGRTGVGKSRLCAWLRRTVAEGGWMTPVEARFRPGSEPRGLRDAIRAALGVSGGHGGPEALLRALADVDRDGRVDGEGLVAYLWPSQGRRPALGRTVRVIEGLVRCLAGRRPLFVWLDDLPHADAETLVLFDHLAAHLVSRPAPVLVVATRRREGAGPGAAPASGDGPLAQLLERHQANVEIREVPRLTDEAAGRLARHLLPVEPAVVGQVTGAARGNPLYVVEALQYLIDAGALTPDGGAYRLRDRAEAGGPVQALPRTLVELVRRRLMGALAAAPEGDLLRGLAERLALLGGAFPFGLVEALERPAGIDAVRLETGLEGLVRLGILVDEPDDAYAFVHEVVREALLEEVAGRPDAPRLHARVAAARAAWAGDEVERVAEEIARHHRAAGATERAVEFMLLAARGCRVAGRPAMAANLLLEADRWLADEGGEGRASGLRADVMQGLAEVALDAGDPERAVRMAGRLETWARATGDRVRLAAALRLRGEAAVAAGNGADATPPLDEARTLLLELGDGGALARVELARGRVALQAGDLEAARRRFGEAAAGFAAAGDARGEAAARRASGELAVRAGDREAAVGLLSEAISVASAVDDHRLVAQASWRLGELLRQSGHLEDAALRYRQAVEACEAVGDPAGAGRSLRGLGDTLRLLQRPEAARTYRRAAAIFEALGDRFQLAVCATQLGRIAVDAGDPDGAEPWFERALALLEQFDDPVRVGVVHAFLARTAQRRGDAAARDHRLAAALCIDAARPLVVADWPRVLEEVAEGVAAEGDPRRAAALLARAAEVWTALRRPDEAARCRDRVK